MKIKVGASARHIHLNKNDYDILFPDIEMKCLKKLSQPFEYASDLYVDISNEDKIIRHVRVLGPLRGYTQLEVSKTDAYMLGINPPVAKSGCLGDAELVTITTQYGNINKKCAIIAERHIHMTKAMRKELNLLDKTSVKVEVLGVKGAILNNVMIKEMNDACLEVHLDLDDVNSTLIKDGDEVTLLY